MKSVFVGRLQASASFGFVTDGNTSYCGSYGSGTALGYRWEGNYPSASGAYMRVYSIDGGTYYYAKAGDGSATTPVKVTVNAGELIASTTTTSYVLIIWEA